MAPQIDPAVSVILDRPRHLRFTNQALREAELLLSEIWQKDVSILRVMFDPNGLGLNAITVLLLCGLRAEDPALTLAQADALMTFPKLTDILAAIYDAWNLHTASAQPATEETASSPFSDRIPWDRLWSFARIDLGLSDDAFWGLTLHELDVLSVRWRQQQLRRDGPVAMLIQVMLNVNRDTKTRPYPFELGEVMQALGHAPEPVEPSPPATVEELHQKFSALSQMFSASRNGQTTEG